MGFVKRIFLFLALNALVVITISFFLNLFHVQPYLTAYGLDLWSLGVFCFIWGVTGAVISLLLSRTMARWMMGIRLIDDESCDPEEKKLFQIVQNLAQKAGLPLPQVGIYSAREVNAFATGPSRSRSLVAVSSGLLERMNEKELSAVLGHELSHIANGDMVTMTLLQGIVNAFVMFLARVLAFAISSTSRRSSGERSTSGSYFLFVYLFEILFLILGSLVTSAFSRYREFRADRGGAELAGKDAMMSALHTLKVLSEIKDSERQPEAAIAALKISQPRQPKWRMLFATHPPLDVRIERLQSL